MSKLCNGVSNNQAVKSRNSKSYCEGIQYRATGTAVNFPAIDNPHEENSEDAAAWARGWLLADTEAGNVIARSSAPCCAVPAHVILA